MDSKIHGNLQAGKKRKHQGVGQAEDSFLSESQGRKEDIRRGGNERISAVPAVLVLQGMRTGGAIHPGRRGKKTLPADGAVPLRRKIHADTAAAGLGEARKEKAMRTKLPRPAKPWGEGIDKHHVFGGANRKHSERYHCYIYLPHYYHVFSEEGPHHSAEAARELHRRYQSLLEEAGWTREEFRETFGKSYL